MTFSISQENLKLQPRASPTSYIPMLVWLFIIFATGDEDVLSRIKESIRIQKVYAFDSRNGGYFQILNRDLSVADSSKSKHSHYGYTSSLLINLMMITREKEIRDFAEELMQISFNSSDRLSGWLVHRIPGSRHRLMEDGPQAGQ